MGTTIPNLIFHYMYKPHFIYSFISWLLVLLLKILWRLSEAVRVWVYKYLFKILFSILLVVYPEVELLGRKIFFPFVSVSKAASIPVIMDGTYIGRQAGRRVVGQGQIGLYDRLLSLVNSKSASILIWWCELM